MRRWIAIALAAGCTRTELSSIDLADRTDTVAFLVVVDETDRALRVTGAFGIQEGRLTFGERPQLVLAKQESGAVLIEMIGAELSMRFPDFVPARASEITARVASPPPEPELEGDLDPENPTKDTAIPPGSKLTDAAVPGAIGEGRAAAILDQLTLTLPVDPEYCRPTQNAFSNFGRDEVVDPAGALEEVILLGERAILRTAAALHLLERGAPLDRSRSFDVSILDTPSLEASLRDVDVDPIDGRLMAAVYRRALEGPGDSMVIELRLDERIEYVGTATRVDAELEAISISSAGRTAALAEEGLVYLEEPDGSYSSRRIDDDSADPKARSLLWTDGGLIATSRNRLHFADPIIDRFNAELLVLPNGMSLHIAALEEGDGEVWSGGNNGWVARIIDGGANRISIVPPPRYRYCATAADPELFEDDVVDIALFEGYAYLALKTCSALIAIRRSDGCVSIVSPDGERPHLVDDDEEGLRSIDVQDGELVVTDALSRARRVSF